MSSRPTRRFGVGHRQTIHLVALAAIVPLFLGGDRRASAGALGQPHASAAELDALHTPDLLLTVRAEDPARDDARNAIDGKLETAWTGRAGQPQWRWTSLFAHPVHLGLVRAHFGSSSASGIPTAFRWETLRRGADDRTCTDPAREGDWSAFADGAGSVSPAVDRLPKPSRRSWFVDREACGLRLIVDRTNAGLPVLREVEAIQSAENVLRGARITDDGTFPGFTPAAAIDGVYASRWAGARGKSRWALRVDLPEPQPVDRVRLVLGFDATSVARAGSGRNYAIAWGPIHYSLEASEDGEHFASIATEPVRADGVILPVRRRMVTLAQPRWVRALRLVMSGATGENGLPEPSAVPVVREIAAYRSDDKRPVLAEPWILSINANPSGQSHLTPGGEVCNDAYHAKFLQARFASLVPALRLDDRYARSLGPHGEPLDAPPRSEAGEVLESIEADDPQLDARWLSESSPPPIAVMSGSNDWDYARETGPDTARPKRWHWDPLRDARLGGMGQLTSAVRGRVAPFLGFCGGAQLLALLESHPQDRWPGEDDLRVVDRVLRRNDGLPIRGFAVPAEVVRAWPTDFRDSRTNVQFAATDPLFADLAGPARRSASLAFPELHSDAILPEAFLPGGPLERFEIVASSSFCAPEGTATSAHGGEPAEPSAPPRCTAVTEAFRSRGGSWPVIGAQFHPEQRDFSAAVAGDPPESIADPFLFLAAAYETLMDAYVNLAP
jgi:hypothetical protein